MPVVVFPSSQLLWVRVAAVLFTCVAFSVAAHGAALPLGSMNDWCIFCWALSFACSCLVLLVEQCGLQARIPVSWSNFPITVACYACLLCLSATVIFPVFFLKDQQLYYEVRDYRIVSTVFSCLATVVYMWETGTNMVEYLTGATTDDPHVLMIGEDHRCSQAFVILNGTAMEYPSLLGAVDGCFKTFFVFDVNYPKPCAQIWEFIQTVIFEMPGHESNAVKLMRAQLAMI
ncbi:myeloid-associated differentiation marker homolog isoform X2 [Nothobranchius furzeri]|uniref:myeloid-associated differentiation marker homolog isoform X2 n=1 Tax=Nothobranchius furzeri TaxID=105023 RepID=UPI003904B76D